MASYKSAHAKVSTEMYKVDFIKVSISVSILRKEM